MVLGMRLGVFLLFFLNIFPSVSGIKNFKPYFISRRRTQTKTDKNKKSYPLIELSA